MRSTFHGLETGKRGLFAQQNGLNTVGHNIANANTQGYSRQRVNFGTTPSMEYPGMAKSTEAGQIGTGVYTMNIERVRERFLDVQYRNENKASGEWEIRQDTLEKLQAIYNEPSETGLSTVLDNFFLAWQTLGRNPNKIEARTVVLQATQDLVQTVGVYDAKLTELDRDIAENVSIKLEEFNGLSAQIVGLNDQIRKLEVLGDNANDLRDRRDLLVDQMSKIANVTVTETTNSYTISVGDQVIINNNQPAVALTYNAATNSTSIPVTGGQVKGMMASRVEYLQLYRDQLDSMVNGLVNGRMESRLPNDYTFDTSVTTLPFDVKYADGTTALKGSVIAPGTTLPAGTVITVDGINGLHQIGYTNEKPTQKAGPLFETKDGTTKFTAANIKVATAIADDIRRISASYSTYVDANGDLQSKVGSGDVAFMLAESMAASIDFRTGFPDNKSILTTGTVSGYMRAMIGQLGAQTQSANRQVENQDVLLRHIDTQRQSISGVSLDEEMSSMIRFQQSYSAAARVVTTVDEMLDTIINRMAAH